MDKQQKIDALFEKAQLTPTAIPFSESKHFFLQSLEAGALAPKRKFQFNHFKNILIMIGIIGIVSLLVNILISPNETASLDLQKTKTQQEIPASKVSVEKSASRLKKTVQTSENQKFEIWANLIQPRPLREIYLKRQLSLQDGRVHLPPLFNPSQNLDQVQFPKLTEQEIAANHKQKKKMIKDLSKFDRREYAYIPSGTYSYKGKPVSVQAFYMQRREVSNLEYRTFLFDLLIQDRKDEFLIAAPDQTLWVKALADSLIDYQNDYFSNPDFNDFPVVNVSKQGAEMYCKWITIGTNKTKKSDFINDVRIPELLEWTYAASNLGKLSTYPWEGKQLVTDGAFNANFKLDEYRGNLALIKQKTKTKRKTRSTFEHTAGFIIAWDKIYEPTELGLYNMSGNVAEMVSLRNTPDFIQIDEPRGNQLITCGGSWMSPIEDLEIFNEKMTDKVDGHPSIGFRVVVTHFQAN